jgi:glycosyltransferase involved in cell wall biosynthesis
MSTVGSTGPELSVVVVVYRMRREAPRTLRSLGTAYQQGVGEDRYEVIVVENSSDQMLSEPEVRRFGPHFRYLVNPRSSRSPAGAINLGAREARGRHLMLMVDGARILSPGVLRHTLTAFRLYDRPVVATLAWHLGPDNQARSIHKGYCQEVEDRLLAESGWEADGYQLFRVSALAGSCGNGWFFPITESSCISMSREHYEALGGYSEEFQSPGGGLLNLDFYARAVADPKRPVIILLGEGSFHQFHGGVATNRRDDEPLRQFREEYQRLRGRPFTTPQTTPIYFGGMPETAKPFMRRSFNKAQEIHRQRFPHFTGTPADPVRGAPPGPVVQPGPRSAAQGLAVLGMHRSGTSALSGTLMECGVDFGQVSRWNRHNDKGNNENQAIVDLHDGLLADNGGAWNKPPETVRWESRHREARDAILGRLRATGSAWWGFKDPRTLLTLDGWIEAVPGMRLVGIFRHPEAVAQSLIVRSSLSRARGLDLWCQYNRRLLALHRQRPFPILYFSENLAEFRQQLVRLVALLSLEAPAQGLQFLEPELLHAAPLPAEPLPAEAARLYGELHAAAFCRPEVQQALFENRQPA